MRERDLNGEHMEHISHQPAFWRRDKKGEREGKQKGSALSSLNEFRHKGSCHGCRIVPSGLRERLITTAAAPFRQL